jgi:hypothetical protein
MPKVLRLPTLIASRKITLNHTAKTVKSESPTSGIDTQIDPPCVRF